MGATVGDSATGERGASRGGEACTSAEIRCAFGADSPPLLFRFRLVDLDGGHAWIMSTAAAGAAWIGAISAAAAPASSPATAAVAATGLADTTESRAGVGRAAVRAALQLLSGGVVLAAVPTFSFLIVGVFGALGGGLDALRVKSSSGETRLRIVEFQWFLIALSVRPGSRLAISAHLFPSSSCAARMVRSSSAVHGVFFISGFRWLCHLHRERQRERERARARAMVSW
jgi:hypothetical protein